jgi:hypothetical protein
MARPPKPRWQFGKPVDVRVLELLAEHDRLSTAEMLTILRKEGLVRDDTVRGKPRSPMTETAARKRISNMKLCGYLYYTVEPGNRIRMTIHGEATLVQWQEKKDAESLRVPSEP